MHDPRTLFYLCLSRSIVLSILFSFSQEVMPCCVDVVSPSCPVNHVLTP